MISHSKAQKIFMSDDKDKICDTLLSLSFYDEDWKWVQDQCLILLDHADIDISGLATTCIGHLARIHKQLDLNKVVPMLNVKAKDPDIGGRAQDALDDIDIFIKRNL